MPWFKSKSGRRKVTVEAEGGVAKTIEKLAKREGKSPEEYGLYLLQVGLHMMVPSEDWEIVSEYDGLLIENTRTVRIANGILTQALGLEAEEFVLLPLDDYIELRYRVNGIWERVPCQVSHETGNVAVEFWSYILRRYEQMAMVGFQSVIGISYRDNKYNLALEYSELHGADKGPGLHFQVNKQHV